MNFVTNRIVIATFVVGYFASAAESADAQVVQLPTFSFFQVQTSIIVPDSGAGYARSARPRAGSLIGRFGRGASMNPAARQRIVLDDAAPRPPRLLVDGAARQPTEFRGRTFAELWEHVAREQRTTRDLIAVSGRGSPPPSRQ